MHGLVQVFVPGRPIEVPKRRRHWLAGRSPAEKAKLVDLTVSALVQTEERKHQAYDLVVLVCMEPYGDPF